MKNPGFAIVFPVKSLLCMLEIFFSKVTESCSSIPLALDNVIDVKVTRLPPFLGIVLRHRYVQLEENAYNTIKNVNEEMK